jgi:hypothetical protein
LLAGGLALVSVTSQAQGATTPAGFSESVVFSGLTNPTAFRFSPDGRIFVAEKRGVIKVFDSLTDTTPTTFADLNVNVYNFWDRGLLGMTLAPTSPPIPTSTSCTPTTTSSDRPRPRLDGAPPGSTPTPARPRRAPPVTGAWSVGGCPG